MEDKKIVLTTAGTKQEADRIAHALIERHQAACVNVVGPMESVYRWKNEVETAEEWLLIIKTTAAAFDAVRDTIRELHSYELPECVLIPIETGTEQYLRWIEENIRV